MRNSVRGYCRSVSVAIAVDVERGETFDPGLHRHWRILICLCLIGEQRVATDLRHLYRIQQGRTRRHLEAGIVGVPVSATVREPDRLPVLFDVREDQDVRMLRVMELVEETGSGGPKRRANSRNAADSIACARNTRT